MTTQEEKILFWTHYHDGSATKEQIRKHLANVLAVDRNKSISSLKKYGLLETKIVRKHYGRPTTFISLTNQGEMYIKRMKEEGRIE